MNHEIPNMDRGRTRTLKRPQENRDESRMAPCCGWNKREDGLVSDKHFKADQKHTPIIKGDKRMREKVEKALAAIRPSLQADGGDVELVDVVDGVVKLRLQGACAGCPMSQMTLKMGIEQMLKKEVPEVKSVENVF